LNALIIIAHLSLLKFNCHRKIIHLKTALLVHFCRENPFVFFLSLWLPNTHLVTKAHYV